MFISIALVGIVAAIATNAGGSTLAVFITGPLLVMSLLLPIVAVLAVTGEWTQRTAITTFVLVPRRSLVLLARLVAVVALTMATTGVVVGCSTVAFAILRPSELARTSWPDVAGAVGPLFALAFAVALSGTAMGYLLLNTPLAIVVTILVPFTYEVGINVALPQVGPWISSLAFSAWLAAPTGSWLGVGDAPGLGQALTSLLLWIVLPGGLGWLRQLRREAK